MKRWMVVGVLLAGVVHAQPPEPYVESYYDHSYQVFVGAGNLVRARQVISNALYWHPNDIRWLERLAQVARWQGDVTTSLRAWQQVASLSDSPHAWEAVLELAPATYNNELIMEARKKSLREQPYDTSLIEDIARQYELLGKPAEGVQFLSQWNRRYPSRAALREMQILALNMGDGMQAARFAREYMERFGPELSMALDTARLLWLQGERERALSGLQADAQRMDYHPEVSRYLAVMSAEQGKWDLSIASYNKLVENDDDTIPDLYMFINLLRYFDRDQMTALMDRAWEKLDDPNMAVAVLYTLQDRGDYRGIEVFLGRLSPEQRKTLEQDPAFLRFLAGLELRNQRHHAAKNTLRRALHLAPGDRDSRINWLWLNIAIADEAVLRRSVQRWQSEAVSDSRYWPAFSAAYLELGDPETALRYQRAMLKQRPHDWLTQWNYAQTLMTAGRHGEAWPVLRSLWRNLPQSVDDDRKTEYQFMLLTLSQTFESGDAALARAQAMVGSPPDVSDSTRAEWLAQWSLYQDSRELAQSWYFHKWQADGQLEAGSALAYAGLQDDQDQVAQVREQYWNRLTLSEQLDTQMRLDEERRAAETLMRMQEGAPELAGEVMLQESLLLPTARSTGLGLERRRLGALDVLDWQFTQYQPVSDHSELVFQFDRRHFTSNDEELLVVDDQEHRAGLYWNHRRQRYRQSLFVGQRDLLDHSETMAELELGASWHTDWSGTLGYQWQMPADESSLLLLGGSRTGLRYGLAWAPSATWQNSADLSDYTYHDLDGETLGSGTILNMQSTWRPWLSRFSPGLKVRHTRADFSEKRESMDEVKALLPPGQSAVAIPEDYHETELSLLLGMPDVHLRPHRLQGWAELGYSHNSLSGDGFTGRAGVEGPFIGRDGWKLYLEQQLNTGGSGEDSYRAAFEYRIYY
ncbi:MAG: tetratricopeptide repeat protein [Alcanivorax nanhaiticus]